MNYNLENIKEMTGTLAMVNDSGVIPDVYIQMDRPTARKLAPVLRSNKVTSKNQELFFTSISIPKDALAIFTKGQSNIVKDGNRYVTTTAARTPAHFNGIMQAIVKGSDG